MGKKICITVLLVALVTIGISIVALEKNSYKKLEGTPDEIVIAAMKNTNKKIAEEQEKLNKSLGIDKVEAILKSKAKELYFDLDVSDNDADINGKLQISTNKFKGNLAFEKNQEEALGIEVYRDGMVVGLNIPQLFEVPYAIKLDTIKEDYQKSALASLIDIDTDTQEFAEVDEIIKAAYEYMKGLWTLKDDEQFIQNNMLLQQEILKDFNLEEEDSKESVQLTDGTRAEWTVYTCILDNQQMMNFINQELDALMQYDFVKNYFEVLAKASDMSLDDFMEEVNQQFIASEAIKAHVSIQVDERYFRGLRIELMDNDITLMTIETQYLGFENLTEVLLVNLNSEIEGLNFSIKTGQDLTNNFYKEAMTLTLNEIFDEAEQYLTAITYNYTYDTTQNEDNVEVDFNLIVDDDFTATYSTEGTMTIDKDKVEVTLPDSEIILKDSQSEERIQFDLNYGIQKIKENDIIIDTTGETYVLEMTEQELDEALETIQNRLIQVILGF